jgi:hypothetical protein
MKTLGRNNIATSNRRSTSTGSGSGRGGGGGRFGHGGRGGRIYQATIRYSSQDNVINDDAETMDTSDKHNNHNKLYNGATPWSPTPNTDDAVFHEPVNQVKAPLVCSFTGTLEIGFSIGTMADISIMALLKRFISFAMKTDSEFRILPLKGGNQSIT